MPEVTYTICSRCPVLQHCTMYIPSGQWRYNAGVDPCRMKKMDVVDIGRIE